MKAKCLEAMILSGTMLGTLILGMPVYAVPGGSETDTDESFVEEADVEEELAERYSLCMEGFNEDGSLFSGVSFAITKDESGMTLTASTEDERDLTEYEILRLAEGDLYVDSSWLMELSEMLDLSYGQTPISGWIKIPGLDMAEISKVLGEMPDIYDLEDAWEILYDQMVTEDYMNDTVTLQVNRNILQIGAILLDQMQERNIQAIANMDLNKIAGEYGKMIKEEASILDNENIYDLYSVLPSPEASVMLNLSTGEEAPAFSEQYLKMKLIAALLKEKSNIVSINSFSDRVRLQYLGELISELGGTVKGINTNWKMLLENILRREDIGLTLCIREDGSFDGTIGSDGRIQIKGKDADDSFRAVISEYGDTLMTVSMVSTDMGFDLTADIEGQLTTIEIRPIYNEWGVSGIGFTLKQGDGGYSYNNKFMLSGECKIAEKGYEITVDALYLDGKFWVMHPVTMNVEFVSEETRSGVILSVDDYSGINAKLDIRGPIRLSLMKEAFISDKKVLPSAIDGMTLIRMAFREEMSRLQKKLEEKNNPLDNSKESETETE